MDSQQSDLFDTASQPDTVADEYTFLEFNTQGDSEFDYQDFGSPTAWPTPSDSISIADVADRGEGGAAADHHSEASSPSSLSAGAGNGAKWDAVELVEVVVLVVVVRLMHWPLVWEI